MYDEVARTILEGNCILLHGTPETKGEVTYVIAIKTIRENINDKISYYCR